MCIFFFDICVNESKNPNILKQVNITSAFKKSYRVSKESYCSLSGLLVIVKTFNKLLNKQVTVFMDQFLSKSQSVFWKG